MELRTAASPKDVKHITGSAVPVTELELTAGGNFEHGISVKDANLG